MNPREGAKFLGAYAMMFDLLFFQLTRSTDKHRAFKFQKVINAFLYLLNKSINSNREIEERLIKERENKDGV